MAIVMGDTKPDPRDAGVDVAAIEASTDLVVSEARAIVVTDDETYAAAGAFLTGTVKAALDEIAATFDPIQKKAYETHREIVAQRKRHVQPLLEAETIVKSAMSRHIIERKRIAAEAEAERQRVAREAAEQQRLEEAAALEDAGHTEAAAEKIDEPIVPTVMAPAPELPKADGVAAKTITKFRIIDPKSIGRAYLVPDEKKIGQIVRAMGADAAELVGGIEVYEEPSIAASAR